MHRFTNILFSPLGDKDNAAAVRRVSELADQNGAKLTLLGVVPEPTGFRRALHRPRFFDDVQNAEIAAMTKRLNRWASKSSEPPIEAVTTLGSQALEIIDLAIVQGHDLVVITTDEDRHDKATIQRLLRKCPCPVWVIRPTRARIQRVLAAVNPDPDEADLNRTILELASSMVERFGGELHLVHAWELYGEETMRSSAFLHTTPADLDSYLKEERATHARAITDLLTATGLRDAAWKIHLDKGRPEDVVPQVITKSRINLLVMGTLARTGIRGVLIGNTAEKILDQVRCSVVAVKPSGFTSPLASPTT